MSKSVGESTMLFKPLLAAGMILVAFGIFCIWIGTSVISLQEEGEGFKIIGIRFLVGGIISIILGFIAKYHLLIKYLLKQLNYRRRPEEDTRPDWYKP
jgi:Na+/H+-translocating membrane pyrophosphatase